METFVIAFCLWFWRPDSQAVETESESAENYSAIGRAIEVVQKSDGVFFYRLSSSPDLENDISESAIESYRIYDEDVTEKLKQLIADNRDYEPDFKARCLPQYDSALKFSQGEKKEVFLFSFRCNTILYKDGPLWKDFTPQRNDFYTIFHYEINENTANRLN